MTPLWKKAYCLEKNHRHFPELASSNSLKSWFWNLTGCRLMILALAMANLLLGGFYLSQINRTATSGYEIKDLKNELDRLAQENKNYNLTYIKLQSMDQIVSAAGGLNLVPADNAETIEAGNNAIAINR